MAKESKLTDQDNELLAELGIEIEVKKVITHTKLQERIIAGFEEIQKFVDENSRLPKHGEDRDVFERLLAIRFDQILRFKDHLDLLRSLDYQNLIDGNFKSSIDTTDDLNDEELLEQLGVVKDDKNSITNLKYVKPRAEKRAVEEMANRIRCEDFEQFKPLFDEVKKDIDINYRTTVRFRKDAGFTKTSIKEGKFVIIGGQMAYIANIGESFKAPNGEDDARLRVIYSNGTESNILLRSLIRAMYKDETSRFISDPNLGPLFSGENSDDDQKSGTIYVLRSLSNHPIVQNNKDVVHKIGVTGNDLNKRLANAKNDPTFLMADVEIIATYKLANISRTKLESIIHRFFGAVNMDIEIKDRFGRLVKPREWYLVPVFIIDEMVNKITDGTISDYYYDPSSAKLKRH